MQQENSNKSSKRERSLMFKAGLTAFLVLAAAITFFLALYKLGEIFAFFGKVLSVIEPILIGAVIAYLANPMQNFFNKYALKILRKIFKKNTGFEKTAAALSITLAMVMFVLFIFVFFYLIIPEFSKSIATLIETIPSQFEALVGKVNGFLDDNEKLVNDLNTFFESQKQWFSDVVTKNANAVASYVATGVLGFVGFLKNFVVGFMVAIYILASKKIFAAQCKKILCAFLSREKVNTLLRATKKCDSIYGGFINGKLLDSLIIGILCFIGVTVLKMPYTVLISVIVGVTNVIPVFGPYIGAIPSAFLVLLESPIKCVYFVIFIILLQTLDGNVIGPKILGDSTGLSAFWVMVSIIVGGGFFGVLGMLLGVPTFAVIYYLVKTILRRKLIAKNLPVKTQAYGNAADINTIYTEHTEAENSEKESVD